MTTELWNSDTHKISEMQTMLRSTGSYHSFKSKKEYIERINSFKNVINFPWRKDQKEVIDTFLEFLDTQEG